MTDGVGNLLWGLAGLFIGGAILWWAKRGSSTTDTVNAELPSVKNSIASVNDQAHLRIEAQEKLFGQQITNILNLQRELKDLVLRIERGLDEKIRDLKDEIGRLNK